jgi:predicted DNA-binding transcriptional regulator AlpA
MTEIFTATALAAEMNISLKTLETRVCLGKVPSAIRFGGNRVWLRADVQHLLPDPHDVHPDLLRVEQLAAFLQVSTTECYRLMRAGFIPRAIEIGGARRWSRRAVLAHIAALPRK